MATTFLKSWKQIPRPVILFFAKGLLLFIVWKSAYLFFLLPHRTLDDPLTRSVGVVTAHSLNLFTRSHDFYVQKGTGQIDVDGILTPVPQMDIYRNNEKTLGIADVCNGLELFVLYAGFLICFPAPLSRKAIFMTGGFILIYLLNILRCTALVFIYMYYNEYLDFSHHFVFTAIVYGFIFLLWYIFVKKNHIHGRTAQ